MEFERAASVHPAPMVDPFGRTISYLRVSVTDRCDFRCVYCMAENMTFLPKADLLTLEELDRLCSAFIVKGVRKRAAGAARHHDLGSVAVAPSR
jgi:GTP 3',8-cyclase